MIYVNSVVMFTFDCWMMVIIWNWKNNIDGLMQKRRNSIADALELRRFCIKPSIRFGRLHTILYHHERWHAYHKMFPLINTRDYHTCSYATLINSFDLNHKIMCLDCLRTTRSYHEMCYSYHGIRRIIYAGDYHVRNYATRHHITQDWYH